MTVSRIHASARLGIAALVLGGLFASACGDKKGQVPPLPTDKAGNVVTPVPS